MSANLEGKERKSTISPEDVEEILKKSTPVIKELRKSLEQTFDTPPGFSTLQLKNDGKGK